MVRIARGVSMSDDDKPKEQPPRKQKSNFSTTAKAGNGQVHYNDPPSSKKRDKSDKLRASIQEDIEMVIGIVAIANKPVTASEIAGRCVSPEESKCLKCESTRLHKGPLSKAVRRGLLVEFRRVGGQLTRYYSPAKSTVAEHLDSLLKHINKLEPLGVVKLRELQQLQASEPKL